MYRTVTVEVGFCYGHRLHEYVGKCAHLHGHQGTVQVTLGSTEVDRLGMVIDFGVVKSFVKEWVDTHWDHRMMLHENDPILPAVMPHDTKIHPVPFNPTAENLGAHLFDEVKTWLQTLPKTQNPSSAQLISVKFWETPTSSVICHADGLIATNGVICGQNDG
ncbi:MAG: 6-carboxytetrahydropterin synthase [bacterium]|nr:6-carboxytetrahydropterin synthase [bacterium]